MSESAEASRWLHSPSGRSKRKEIVGPGCFVLDHDATGRFYMGQSERVSADVDVQIAQLKLGKHPCKLLNALYERDSEIRVYEYPIKKKKERSELLKALRDNTNPAYLCLNPKDVK